MSLQAIIRAQIEAVYKGTNALGTPQFPVNPAQPITLKSGTGDLAADLLWAQERNLAGSANDALDLTALTDAFGNAINLAHVKAIYIKAADANVGNLEVGNAASNGWIGFAKGATDTVEIAPGGVLLWSAPHAGVATGSTNKILKVLNTNGAAAVYDIVVIGTSA